MAIEFAMRFLADGTNELSGRYYNNIIIYCCGLGNTKISCTTYKFQRKVVEHS